PTREIITPVPPDGVRVGQLGHRVEVTAIESVKAQTYKLHVPPRHRLLLQPHGFEGFGVVAVESPSCDAPGAEDHDKHSIRFDLYSVPAAEARSGWHNDGLAAVGVLIHRDCDALPRLKECAPEISDPLTAVIDASLNSQRPREVHFGVG